MNIFRSSKVSRALAVAAIAATSSLGLLAATQGAAHATNNELFVSSSTWLNIAVRGGSTSAGADVIQWWSTGGSEQRWNIVNWPNLPGFQIQNDNSAMCITTDGVAGHAVTQQPCDVNNVYQRWVASYSVWGNGYTYTNRATGLNLDVAGNSYWGGAEIDAWYPNNALNQVFITF